MKYLNYSPVKIITETNHNIGICGCGTEVLNPPKSKRVIICANCKSIEQNGVGIFEHQSNLKKLQFQRIIDRQMLKPKKEIEPKGFVFNCDDKASGKMKCEEQCAFCIQKYRKLSMPIKQISSKQAVKNTQIKEAKLAVLEDAQENDTCFCQGCGRANTITFSHNVGIGQSTKLAAVKGNIDLMCLDCHMAWESNTFERLVKLKNLLKLLKFQHENAPEKFEKKVTVFLENQDSTIARNILTKIEKW